MFHELITRISTISKKPVDLSTAQVIIDQLPPKCELVAEFNETEVQFQAVDAHGFKSEWSGWFIWDGTPIQLHWGTFWIED